MSDYPEKKSYASITPAFSLFSSNKGFLCKTFSLMPNGSVATVLGYHGTTSKAYLDETDALDQPPATESDWPNNVKKSGAL